MIPTSRGVLAGVLLALGLLGACRQQSPAQFSVEHRVTNAQRPTEFGLDQRGRFGLGDMRGTATKTPMAAPQGQGGGATAFTAETPQGWAVLPTSEFRQLNYRLSSDPSLECYLSAGNLRGGLLANANRWVVTQFGQTAMSQAEFDALPRHLLVGQSAALVGIEGSFAGMGGEAKPGYKLLGLVGGSDEDMVTLKMTGPKALVEAESARFLALAASIHRGGSAAPNAKPSSVGNNPAADATGLTVGDGYVANAPTSWATQPPSSFRQLNWRIAGSDAECYLTAGGLRGGLLANANRWIASQFGQQPMTQAEFDALPQHPLVGKSARLVRVSGDFRGMGGEAKPGFQLLGLVGGTDDEMITLKLVGPKTVVEAEYAHFLEVAASVREASSALPETQQPVVSPGVSPAPTSGPPLQPSGADAAAAPFAATIPATWPPLGDTGSRLLRHRFGKDGECYVGQLGGEIAQMLGVWCGEFAAPVPDAAGIAALPRVPMLSGEAVLLDLKGEHQGMAGQKRPDMRLLVAVRQTEQGIVFCKFLGVAADVELERANFLQFCATLKRSDG
jgi:hypothetical protein